MSEASKNAPVPASAKLTLEFDRPEYFLGENVLVHVILENTGTEPLEFSFGGDYRGATRAMRFQVTATDQAGQSVVDPNPAQQNFGGLGGNQQLKPGQKFIQSLPLMRYRQIERPGRYTIAVTHDFGWKEGARKRPVATGSVAFVMPDAAAAERVIKDMEKRVDDQSGNRIGERSKGYADFGCLLQPVYLEPLLRRAQQGKSYALDGLGNIPTPAATEALIKLAGSENPKVALAAALTVNNRLPDPEPPKKAVQAVGPEEDPQAVRRRLASRSWDAKFVPEVRALAAKFLAQKDSQAIAAGAFMIGAVGRKEDAPAVLAALARALAPMVDPRKDPSDNILDLPEPLPALLRTMQTLRTRGYSQGESLSGDGEILLYFQTLVGNASPRPAHWLENLLAFGPNSRFPVRETALRSIPQRVPAETLPLIKGQLADPDLGVVRAACTVAQRSGDRSFVVPLLDIVATEHHEFLLSEASEAARALGAGVDLLDRWSERLADEKLYGVALDSLQTVIDGLPGGSSGRTDLTRAERLSLRQHWRAFLAQHGRELRAGKRFKVGDPALLAGLFGRARSWQLANGRTWPAIPPDVDGKAAP